MLVYAYRTVETKCVTSGLKGPKLVCVVWGCSACASGAPIEGLAATMSVPTPAKLMEAAAKAVAGATRILGREGLRLGKAARDELQEIVTTQTQQLLGLVGQAR